MSFTLSAEQLEKLKKLELEMEERQKEELAEKNKKEETFLTTGVPIDIAGLDVIKIGTLIGLIRSKESFNRNESNSKSLIQILLGEGQPSPVVCPPNYYRSFIIMTENDKLHYQRQYVHDQSKKFVEFRDSIIKTELEVINKKISVQFNKGTIDDFKNECLELIEVLIDELANFPDDTEIWENITVVTNSLLGVLNICEYKALVVKNIGSILRLLPKSQFVIMRHLSNIDRRLSLFNGVLRKCKDYQRQTFNQEKERLCNELEIRRYTKNPQLCPFALNDVVKEICIPSLLYLPIEWVVKQCLVGPYRNNPIGFLKECTIYSGYNGGDFYILKKINEDGGRIWILDRGLEKFTAYIIKSITNYLINIFRIFYKECFVTNCLIKTDTKLKERPPNIFLSKGCIQEPIFLRLLNNLKTVSDGNGFRQLLITIIKNDSPIIPTDYDFFNFIKSKYDKCPPYIPKYPNKDIVFRNTFFSLFDDYDIRVETRIFEFLSL